MRVARPCCATMIGRRVSAIRERLTAIRSLRVSELFKVRGSLDVNLKSMTGESANHLPSLFP
jgi:hypothetical protein